MIRVGAIAGGLLGTLAMVASAKAADPAWPIPVPTQPPISYSEMASGWYVRGDIGYRFLNKGGPSAFPNATSETYSKVFDGTLGFGVKYQMLRGDITYDRTISQSHVNVDTSFATGQPQFTARIRSQTLMANAYFDIGTWSGFTPYVGAGAGVALLSTTNFADTNIMSPYLGAIASGQSKNFAWSAMAGVSYQLSRRWVVDVGYRYLNLGDAQPNNNSVQTMGGPLAPSFKNLTSQEARIGVRFLLD